MLVASSLEFLENPSLWLGLATLIFLEIVLGVDNIIFITLIIEKIDDKYKEKSRVVGLAVALFMRILFLFFLAILIGMTKPILFAGPFSFSVRDIILIVGGVFLMFKTTREMHERIRYNQHPKQEQGVSVMQVTTTFFSGIVQIVLVDLVFSVDSIVTAVGLTHNLFMMITAVCVSMVVMLFTSRWLSLFLKRHPSVVVLCLSFLLMIAFSLLVEGFGVHIPKGYLYTAILFSIMVEILNHFMSQKR